MGLPKKKKEIAPWRQNILDHHNQKPSKSMRKLMNKSSKEKTRAVVKQRDGNHCLLCGEPGPGLHLHRVIYSGMGGGGGVYEPDNCVLLCTNHHMTVHSNKRIWQPILLDKIAQANQRAGGIA